MSAPASIPAKNTSVPRCRHCDLACTAGAVTSPHGTFCCRGCEAVFELLASRQLTAYYDGDERAGVSQKQRRASGSDRFVALDDPDVAARFVRFDDGQVARATFAVPDVHCASGVWCSSSCGDSIPASAGLKSIWSGARCTSRESVERLRPRLRLAAPLVLAATGLLLIARGVVPPENTHGAHGAIAERVIHRH